MKASTLQLLAGTAGALIATGSAPGGFVGTFITVDYDPNLIASVNVYAQFDRPGEDHMLAVAGSPSNPLFIEVGGGGTFYQHPFGTDRAPAAALVEAFPSLVFDTFVTIGVDKVGEPGGQPVDGLALSPGWPGFGPFSIAGNSLSWAVTPSHPQGDPFDPVNSFPGDGSILIGRFSTADGNYIRGQMLLMYVSNGVYEQSPVQFFASLLCPPTVDCNGNGVHDICDIDFGNSADVNGDDIPDECQCLYDLDGDGVVGIRDFLQLLAEWGPCAACVSDVDGDGSVGMDDFAGLLAAWGPCP